MAADNPKPKVEGLEEKVHVWPYLVRLEFLCALFVIIGLTVWSIVIDAPLEEAANPTKTPNPSKAPWYFLGLQDILVYFDLWFAGVIAPVLIIVGLMLIPYLDINPKGNGYYTYHERKLLSGYTALDFWFYGLHLLLWVFSCEDPVGICLCLGNTGIHTK